ncbi:hypothetical protein [Flavobacterium johnsoniae]|uniref:hypothetical protein n=1 Tax=Flavobacterium johnsoniae TaxID=986 RepID=UPI0011EE980D|nr:hypothetical protein [Flavobacterium johnsoniae]
MIEAPSLNTIKQHRQEHSNAICCILFAPKFSKLGYEDIIKRFGYLDSRTGEKLHVYCAGYGAYWNDIYAPDKEDVGVAKYNNGVRFKWEFSQKLFALFIDELELETSWKYSGGTELIMLNSDADFSNCIIFKIEEMIKDKVIDSANDILEALIQHSRSDTNSLGRFSLSGVGKQTAEEIVDSVVSCLPKPFESLLNIWKKGKHYTLVNMIK